MFVRVAVLVLCLQDGKGSNDMYDLNAIMGSMSKHFGIECYAGDQGITCCTASVHCNPSSESYTGVGLIFIIVFYRVSHHQRCA